MNILPSGWSDSGSLADVLLSSSLAMTGVENPLGLSSVESAIVLLVDGLGYQNLSEFRGHARFLYRDVAEKLHTVFPSTTASALSSLTTGELPGQHGMVGYQVRDPDSGLVLNQLSGWGEQMNPATWQSIPTIFERHPEFNNVVISEPKHRQSGFTQAVLRGATYLPVKDLDDRFDTALETVGKRQSLVYLYVADLDSAAHSHGVGSNKWLDALESIDQLYMKLSQQLPDNVGLLTTGDHGVMNVPQDKHIIFERDASFLSEVEAIAGEPRCLQLHLNVQANQVQVQDQLQAEIKDVGIVYSRLELMESGIFGDVADHVVDRMGDLFVLGVHGHAFYTDDSLVGTNMIGQHGGLEAEEIFIPLILAGAWKK